MKSYATLKGTFGTIVAGAILAVTFSQSAFAGAVPQSCFGGCHVNRHDCAVGCVVEGNCGRMFDTCKTGCKDSTVPGPDRKDCVTECRTERQDCRAGVGSCKTSCVDDFLSCRVECKTS